MLNKLESILNILPSLLDDPARWDSLVINRRKPVTERIFTQVGEYRVCLHRFDICDTTESFVHPHSWPMAVKLLTGCYKMKIGTAASKIGQPTAYSELILPSGSMYAMTDPLVFHSVTPLEVTHTVMVNGPSFDESIRHIEVRTTKGKDLDRLSGEELKLYLKWFKDLL